MLPLVLLHGFTGSAASWDQALLGVPPRVTLRPALLGHAPETERTRKVSTFADEMARLADLLPPGPVHLAGYSLGARLALALALGHPARVARLTLVSGQPGLATEAERAARRLADARWCTLLETRGIEAFVAEWEAQPLFATQASLPDAERERHRQGRLTHDPLGLARSLRVTGLGEMPDLLPGLGALGIPVTLLAGELDAKFAALAGRMAAALQLSSVVLAPGAGHDVLLEAPGVVRAALLAENA
jgi:2-succinyl-6-hydroxy-2,4-cyclohexadiene-1-carboxylate synthase